MITVDINSKTVILENLKGYNFLGLFCGGVLVGQDSPASKVPGY
jgi:hypothetical protein